MIIWLASYPKSGNTMMRSMLTAYLFDKEGKFNFDLLPNIKQFPNTQVLKNIGVNIDDHNEIIKNSIRAQESFNKKESVGFVKTHNMLYNFNKKYPFTNLDNTLGVIYIVRDPRNVLNSMSRHFQLNHEKALDVMQDQNNFTYDFKKKNDYSDYQFISSWDTNFESWKIQKKIPIKVIRYEDLQNQTYKILNEVITFINQTTGSKEKINKNKIKNAVNSSSFSKLKDKEKNEGFSEAPKSKVGDKKIPFFNLGPKNNWKIILNDDLKDKLNNIFKKKLEELSYE